MLDDKKRKAVQKGVRDQWEPAAVAKRLKMWVD